MPFKVGVTTGLYYIAHDVSLASTVKKIGYTLTRGADVIEISGDTPHEITETEGQELRNVSKNQGVDTLFHGSLTVPMCMPERTDWRDAQDHMEKSTRSAVNGGCKYVLFHACLHFWVELLTYTGTKLTITMCDHAGNFISENMKTNKRLREWFINHMRDLSEVPYPHYILTEEELRELSARLSGERGEYWMRDEISRELRKNKEYMEMSSKMEILQKKANSVGLKQEEYKLYKELEEKTKTLSRAVEKRVITEGSLEQGLRSKKYEDEFVRKKLIAGKKWRIDTAGRLLDAYKIVAHYLFFTKDPQWMSMADVYSDVMKKYSINYDDDNWLTKSFEKAEKNNDTVFKEFFYAVIGAKFLEGHMNTLISWIDKKFIPVELKGKPHLQEIARNLQITIEIPDARDPKYAGRYMLAHPKQIYSAVRTLRKVIKTERVWMTIDNEHLATQGYDPWVEGKKMLERYPEFGKMVHSVHCTYPTPLHSHYPIELGQTEVYELLWYIRKAGGGRNEKHTLYLIFERGGGDDPFRQSVDALKIMARFLERDVPPDQLPLEFYGLENTAFDERRQTQIMMDHRFDVLKDLFNVPEEEWGLLSTEAVKKGKREIFKKEELR